MITKKQLKKLFNEAKEGTNPTVDGRIDQGRCHIVLEAGEDYTLEKHYKDVWNRLSTIYEKEHGKVADIDNVVLYYMLPDKRGKRIAQKLKFELNGIEQTRFLTDGLLVDN